MKYICLVNQCKINRRDTTYWYIFKLSLFCWMFEHIAIVQYKQMLIIKYWKFFNLQFSSFGKSAKSRGRSYCLWCYVRSRRHLKSNDPFGIILNYIKKFITIVDDPNARTAAYYVPRNSTVIEYATFV